MPRKYTLGLIPQLPDPQDYAFESLRVPANLPKKVDLSALLPPVFDQGRIGSCVANATIAAHMAVQKAQGKPVQYLSRLFAYYVARSVWPGDTGKDSGTTIRAAMKALKKFGASLESLWPYEDIMQHFSQRPPDNAFADALNHQIPRYEAVENRADAMRQALASGYPIVGGILVYADMWAVSSRRPTLRVPAEGAEPEGGHALLFYGYNDSRKHFLVRNSWGEKWGRSGNFYIPYDYFDGRRAFDFWTIKETE